MSARTVTVFLVLLACLGLLLFGMINRGGGSAVAVGKPLETMPLPQLEGSATGSVADYRGSWVLVNMWASWCGPCRDEAPVLEAFWQEHGSEDFTLLGIDTIDNREDGIEFAEEHDLSFPMLHDGSGEYRDTLKMTGVPESVLVDPEGNVALYRPGPVTEEYLDEFVLPLIEGGSA